MTSFNISKIFREFKKTHTHKIGVFISLQKSVLIALICEVLEIRGYVELFKLFDKDYETIQCCGNFTICKK